MRSLKRLSTDRGDGNAAAGKVFRESAAKTRKCCDSCGHYRWYYDRCEEWNCEVDDRSLCGSWTERKKQTGQKRP